MVPGALRKCRGSRLGLGFGSPCVGAWNVSGKTDANRIGRQAMPSNGIQLSALARKLRTSQMGIIVQPGHGAIPNSQESSPTVFLPVVRVTRVP